MIDPYKIIIKPRVAEKASAATAYNVYTFQVSPRANKIQVAEAVHALYKVKPIKVNIVNLPAKRVTVRARQGVKPGVKKALVYLKSGDKIDLA